MKSVPALAFRLAVFIVTVGMKTAAVTVATCTGAPLLNALVVTTAVKGPAVVGLVEKVTVSDVAVAAVTVPTAPSLNRTALLAGVGSKLLPLIIIVVAL